MDERYYQHLTTDDPRRVQAEKKNRASAIPDEGTIAWTLREVKRLTSPEIYNTTYNTKPKKKSADTLYYEATGFHLNEFSGD